MTKTVSITYNGAWARLDDDSPTNVDSIIYKQCEYEDKSQSYLNYRRGNGNIKVFETLYDARMRRFPTGLIPKVYLTLKEQGYNVTLHSTVKPAELVEIDLPDWLWEHQARAIATALEQMHCCIQSPTGSGKSIIIAYLVQHFPKAKVLVTVPTKSLLHAMRKTIAEQMEINGCEEEEIGIVGDGKKKWKRVTVATVQSAYKQLENDPELAKSIEVAIHDECHHCGCNSYERLRKVLVNVSYSIGLSGTVMRKDGKLLVVEGLTGPTVMKIQDADLVKRSIVLKPLMYAIKCEHEKRKYKGGRVVNGTYSYFSPNGKPELDDVYEAGIVENSKRNEMIIDVLEAYLRGGGERGGILIIVKAIRHGEILSELAADRGIDLPFVSGVTKTSDRLLYLHELRTHERNALCASQIFNEGEDVKSLECVVNAAAGANEKNVIQIAGRVTRQYDGKTPMYIDFEDSEPYYLSRHSHQRIHYLERRHQTEFIKLSADQLCKELKNNNQ